MDSPALHPFYAFAELPLQPLGDLAGRFVGKGENADPRRIDAKALDQIANTLDEAESFAGTRAG
jgi:hypothetical protein